MRRLPILVCVLSALLAVAGCGAVEDKAKSVASNAVNQAVESTAEGIVGSAFSAALSKAGLKLEGSPDCSSKLDTDVQGLTVKGTVDCTGHTTKGATASSRFNGTIAVGGNGASCKGRFTVKAGGKKLVDKDVDVCQLARGN